MSRVNFEETTDIDRLYKLLNAEESGSNFGVYKEWEVLKEIERQQRRRDYDHSPERIAKRIEQEKQRVLTQQYIDDHPEVVAKLEKRRRK